jgi:hypothetical protein
MNTLTEKLNDNLNEKNSLIEVLSGKSILMNSNRDNDSIREGQENKNNDIQSQSDKD